MRGCPLPGRWAIAVWEGPDASEAGAALDTCGVWQADVAYSLDPETGAWGRWFRARQDLTTLDFVHSLTAVVLEGGREPFFPLLIAFVSNRDGNPEIYVMRGIGGGETRLTFDSAEDGEPAWSPDHSKIAFERGHEIFVMNPNGSAHVNLTNHPAEDAQPTWSPDGTKIAFTSDRDWLGHGPDIYVMNADGSDVTRLTGVGIDHSPAWSPDGTQIAYERYGDIWVMNAYGSDETRLTDTPSHDGDPAWSPDGTEIAFTRTLTYKSWIYVMNADGTGGFKLVYSDNVHDRDPSWSPDGTKIAFVSDRDGDEEVYVMNANGTGVTRLTTGDVGVVDKSPAWSPW